MKNHIAKKPVTILLLSYLVMALSATQAATDYEFPVVLKAPNILSADVVTGPNHTVLPSVWNDGYLNQYSVTSSFGKFDVTSTAKLHIRINELNAIAAMNKVKGKDEFATSMKAAGKGVASGVKSLVTSPVKTISGTVSGVGKLFSRAGESIFGGSRSKTEDSRFKDIIGFASSKREIAYQYGVDVYSDNKVLQSQLDDLAWANYGGGMSVAAMTSAVGGGAGKALTVTGGTRILNEVIREKPAAELRILNREKLKKMNVNDDVADLFIGNTTYSPSMQTYLVAAMEQMKATSNKALFVKFAINTPSDDVALFRQRQAQMYAGFDKRIKPITRFVAIGNNVAARTEQGDLIFIVPVDYLIWTENVSYIVDSATNNLDDVKNIKSKQIWIEGAYSEKSRKALLARGWIVKDATDTKALFN